MRPQSLNGWSYVEAGLVHWIYRSPEKFSPGQALRPVGLGIGGWK
jgi:hypothetical protein